MTPIMANSIRFSKAWIHTAFIQLILLSTISACTDKFQPEEVSCTEQVSLEESEQRLLPYGQGDNRWANLLGTRMLEDYKQEAKKGIPSMLATYGYMQLEAQYILFHQGPDKIESEGGYLPDNFRNDAVVALTYIYLAYAKAPHSKIKGINRDMQSFVNYVEENNHVPKIPWPWFAEAKINKRDWVRYCADVKATAPGR